MSPAPQPTALPDPLAVESMANASILHDLVRAIHALCPGIMDQNLSMARLRLQMLERGAPEVLAGEGMVQAQKIRILELALGRTATQS